MSAREEIAGYIRRHLMGPTFGPDEKILDIPSELYTVAVLFPPSVKGDANEEEPEGFDGDGEHEDPVPLSGQLRPSSMGLSCVVDVEKVVVDISAAQYALREGRWCRRPIFKRIEISRGDVGKFLEGEQLEVVSRWRL